VSKDRDKNYLALFNIGDTAVRVEKTFAECGFTDRAEYKVRDLWMRKELGALNAVSVELPPHGAVLLSLHQ
jgi:hypothetical protein